MTYGLPRNDVLAWLAMTKLRNRDIMKAIIPVAGLGTRMLPATKAIPKEMLP
jgi:UTP--glucose-1-phosphate uridylyltransferase